MAPEILTRAILRKIPANTVAIITAGITEIMAVTTTEEIIPVAMADITTIRIIPTGNITAGIIFQMVIITAEIIPVIITAVKM